MTASQTLAGRRVSPTPGYGPAAALSHGLLGAALLGLAACGGSDEPEPAAETPTVDVAQRVELRDPSPPMRGAMAIEALSETVDSWLEAVGNKLRIRDFEAVARAFDDGFRGEALFPPAGAVPAESETLPLGIRREVPGVPSGVLDRGQFLSALEETVGPWTRVTQSRWRLSNARFAAPPRVNGKEGLVSWGRAAVALHIVGDTIDGGTVVLDASADLEVRNEGGKWTITRFAVLDRTLVRHDQAMFSEVSRAAGVAFDGLRYGAPGNDSDGWNGAASADVNGDGYLDIFTPGAGRGFLYLGQPDGRFEEAAEAHGLLGAGEGTGAVFFDVDLDGDQDLAVAHIGWKEIDGTSGGRSLQLLLNDGEGRFEDVTEAYGLHEQFLPAYSLTAFDADGDGWTDLFVCGYGRMDVERNDSWVEATNGVQDLMLRNDGGRALVDVTAVSGLEDSSWTYASAAADYDEDGDLDLFLGNNFGTSRLMRNAGDGRFEDVTREAGVVVRGNVMGVLWTDIDADGRLDLYLSSPTSTSGSRLLGNVTLETGSSEAAAMSQMANGNKVFLGRETDGKGHFVSGGKAGTRAGWSWSAASPDLDLNGYRDIVCVNGFVTGELSGDT